MGGDASGTASRIWNGRTIGLVLVLEVPAGMVLAANGRPTSRTSAPSCEVEANILILDSSTSAPVVVVSIDLLFVGRRLRERVRDGLAGRVERDNVLIFATHTHYAPATDEAKPELGEADARWVDGVADTITSSVTQALDGAAWQPSSATAGRGDVLLGVNRRRHRLLSVRRSGVQWRPWVMAPDPHGAVDPTLTVLRLDRVDGSCAYVWNFSCHPVGHPETSEVSAHYAGVVRDALRRREGADVPVLFLQGFSGDVRPRHPDTLRPAHSGLSRAALGPGLSSFTVEGYHEWTGALADAALSAVDAAVAVTGADVHLSRSRVRADSLFAGANDDVEVARLDIGDRVTILGVEAEAMAELSLELRALDPERILLPVGCMGHVTAYLPTPAIQTQGGYEVDGFVTSFGGHALAADAGTAFRDHLVDVLAPADALAQPSETLVQGDVSGERRERVSRPLKGVLQISAGAALGQAINLVTLPLVARWFGPDTVGVYSTLFSLTMVLVIPATLQFELAVPLATETRMKMGLARAAIMSATVFSALLTLVTILAAPAIRAGSSSPYWPAAALLGLMVWTTGLFTLLSQALIAEQDYGGVGRRNLTSNAATSLVQLGLGVVLRSASVLVVGFLVGRVVALVGMFRSAGITATTWADRASLREVVSRFGRFCTYFTGSALLNSVAVQAPVLLTSHWFGAGTAGQVGVAFRAVTIPVTIVGMAATQVAYGHLSNVKRGQGVVGRRYYASIFRKAAIPSLLVAGLPLLLAPWLAVTILGPQWAAAGQYAQILGLVAAGSLLSSPVSQILVVHERYAISLVLNAARVVLTLVLAFVANAVWASATAVLIAIAVAVLTTYAATLLAAWVAAPDDRLSAA